MAKDHNSQADTFVVTCFVCRKTPIEVQKAISGAEEFICSGCSALGMCNAIARQYPNVTTPEQLTLLIMEIAVRENTLSIARVLKILAGVLPDPRKG